MVRPNLCFLLHTHKRTQQSNKCTSCCIAADKGGGGGGRNGIQESE